MGRNIRRTVTITITESWTIVWTGDSAVETSPPAQATTIVQDQPTAQEEADETILPAVMTVADPEAQPDAVTAKSGTGSQGKRKRTRRRRAAE